MTGMLAGGRTTKSAHPRFMRLLSRLTTKVAERPVNYTLPFRHRTKAELVATLAGREGLTELAKMTVSCVHYPRRVARPAKQCGVCPACIGRRQALASAGIHETGDKYGYDILGPPLLTNSIPADSLRHPKANLMQIVDLVGLEPDAKLPVQVRSHLYGSRVILPEDDVRPWLDLFMRYRDDWLRLIAKGQDWGLHWARWFEPIHSSSIERDVA